MLLIEEHEQVFIQSHVLIIICGSLPFTSLCRSILYSLIMVRRGREGEGCRGIFTPLKKNFSHLNIFPQKSFFPKFFSLKFFPLNFFLLKYFFSHKLCFPLHFFFKFFSKSKFKFGQNQKRFWPKTFSQQIIFFPQKNFFHSIFFQKCFFLKKNHPPPQFPSPQIFFPQSFFLLFNNKNFPQKFFSFYVDFFQKCVFQKGFFQQIFPPNFFP